jgi:gamma-glutamyltranspeptidase / glutathione hydrolase
VGRAQAARLFVLDSLVAVLATYKVSMPFKSPFRLILVTAVFCAATPAGALAQAERPLWRSPVRARHAVVASSSRIASEVGAGVMRRGGNAVDAAVAVALALAVTYPEAGNLGGGGFMLIRLADGRTTAIDYRERAPAAATRDMFVDASGELIRGEGSSSVGYRASGVPGTVAGLDHALKKYGSGRLTWAQLVEPARRFAAEGFVLNHGVARTLRANSEALARYPESRRVFLKNGKPYGEGELLRQPDLAATLGRLQRSGAREFYEGRTARLIAEDMRRNGGLITLRDLSEYAVREREPLRGTYRGHEVISMPPPSSGGVALISMLNVLEGYDLRATGWNSAETYHLLAETMKRAFADRAAYLADPDFVKIPVAGLTDKSYAARLRDSISRERATKSVEVRNARPAGYEATETTHFSVVDAAGNVVSNTYTINDLYGSKVTAKGTGVLLNDEMDDFTAKPGAPNIWGVIQSEQNAVAPRKRPLSSMTPTIVLRRDGAFWFAVGARGGPRIINAVLQVVVNVVDFDMNIQQAIDAPRVHHQWLPDVLIHEPFSLSPDTVRALEARGHTVEKAKGTLSIAAAEGVMVEEGTGMRLGASDPRNPGLPAGY